MSNAPMDTNLQPNQPGQPSQPDQPLQPDQPSQLGQQPKDRIAQAFANHKAFIPFITCGDPTLEMTKVFVRALADEGADLIELGIPFSDPTAEGVVIQDANLRALTGGVDTDKIMNMVKELRTGSDGGEPVTIPFAFMTYANVVYHYGTERFSKKAAEVGINALILPDVPFEEKQEFAAACAEAGIALVPLIAPTSEERIARIAADSEGFIYLVSSLGVTGMRSEITTDLGAIVAKIREATDTPCAIGFGVSTPEQAHRMAQTADGAIVGSALINVIAKHGDNAEEALRSYARTMIEAAHSAS